MALSTKTLLRHSSSLLLALAGLLGAGPSVAGVPEYTASPGTGNQSFATKYPSYFASRNCLSCHTTDPPTGIPPGLNLYGAAYKAASIVTNGTNRPPNQSSVGPALTTIEPNDADGDGYSNIVEINNLYLADNAGSHPTAAGSLSTTQSAKNGGPPSTVSYSVTLTNTGNITDSFTLGVSVTSGQTTWTPSIVGTATSVPSGGTATITVNVALPVGATTGQSSIATVTAVSQARATISATPLALTTTYPPPVPHWDTQNSQS